MPILCTVNYSKLGSVPARSFIIDDAGFLANCTYVTVELMVQVVT